MITKCYILRAERSTDITSTRNLKKPKKKSNSKLPPIRLSKSLQNTDLRTNHNKTTVNENKSSPIIDCGLPPCFTFLPPMPIKLPTFFQPCRLNDLTHKHTYIHKSTVRPYNRHKNFDFEKKKTNRITSILLDST